MIKFANSAIINVENDNFHSPSAPPPSSSKAILTTTILTIVLAISTVIVVIHILTTQIITSVLVMVLAIMAIKAILVTMAIASHQISKFGFIFDSQVRPIKHAKHAITMKCKRVSPYNFKSN